MSNQWLRLWHDMPNDPKWRTIARVSKQRIGDVIAIYNHLLVAASANANERGRTNDVCSEDLASALDMEIEGVEAILSAMQGRVMDGDRLTGWENRQPKREDDSADRSKAWREKKKADRHANEQERTHANANERKRRTDKEEIREDKILPSETKVSSGSGAGARDHPTDPDGLMMGVAKIIFDKSLDPDKCRAKALRVIEHCRQKKMAENLYLFTFEQWILRDIDQLRPEPKARGEPEVNSRMNYNPKHDPNYRGAIL